MIEKPLPEIGEIWLLPDNGKHPTKRFLLLAYHDSNVEGEACWDGLDLETGNMVELAMQHGIYWDTWRRVA